MTTPQAPNTIFIVDDDEAVRDSLRWLLEANGYRVRGFSGAEEFLNAYEPDQVGVLIADVRMPGMSGLELQEELIARQAPLPIVFITGHGDVPMAVSTMKRSEEHTSALQSLMRISYAVFCLKKKTYITTL